MENPFISARIPPELSQAIEARIKVTGESRSQVLLEALRDYLGIDGKLTTSERLDLLEERIAAAEGTISKNPAEDVNVERGTIAAASGV